MHSTRQFFWAIKILATERSKNHLNAQLLAIPPPLETKFYTKYSVLSMIGSLQFPIRDRYRICMKNLYYQNL